MNKIILDPETKRFVDTGEPVEGGYPWNKGKRLSMEIRAKISQSLKGTTLSEETKDKISQGSRGRKLSEETKRRQSLGKLGNKNPQYGKSPSEETKNKMSFALKGRIVSKETRKNISKGLKGNTNCRGNKLSEEHKAKIGAANKISLLNHYPSEEARRKDSAASKARWQNPEYRLRLSEIHKQQWEDPEYARHVLEGWARRPTEAEKQLETILTEYFPNQFEYNGNCDLGITLNRMVPDFVNIDGRKEVIEVFGDFFHKPSAPWKRTELGRVMAYNSVGYRCLVIWASELKKLPEKNIVTKIKKWRRETK